MDNLHLTQEQIRTQMSGMHQLAEHERHAAADAMVQLHTQDRLHPEALRKELHALQSAGKLNEAARHAIEKKFFPGHTW